MGTARHAGVSDEIVMKLWSAITLLLMVYGAAAEYTACINTLRKLSEQLVS
jgi:hypothetical protein